MSSYISMLEEARAKRWSEAKAVLDTAAREKRELTPAEQSNYSAITKQLDDMRSMIDKLKDDEASRAATEATLAQLARSPQARGLNLKTAEERAVEDKFRSAIFEKNPAPIILRDENARSFYQPGIEARAAREEHRTGLAIGTGTPSTGVGFVGRVLMNLVETSAVLRAGATVITTDSGEPLRIPRQTAYSSASVVAESTAIPEADPTLSQVTLGAFKYGVLITVSNELAEDAGFDLGGYLAQQAGVALGNAFGSDILNGPGTTAPQGILSSITTGVTGPTGTATSFGSQGTAGQGTDLVNSLVGSLAEPYTRSAAFGILCRTSTLTSLRNLKSTQGELVGNSFVNNGPAPFHVDPFVPAMAANAKSLICGDWSRVVVRIVNGMRFEQSRDFAFNTDQTVFRCVMRADAALVDNTGALKAFVHSAT